MRNIKTLSAIGMALIFAFGSAPPLSGEARSPWQRPLKVSVEIGRYDPEPGCKKAVDGCFPRRWTSTREFQYGTPVWVRVTVTNRSKMTVVTVAGMQNKWIRSLVDANGKTPALTKEGCWARDPACPYTDNRIIAITAAPPWYDELLPGKSATWYIDVSRDFVLESRGEYVLSSEIGGFYLTSMTLSQTLNTFFDPYHLDETLVKQTEELRMKPLKFTVLAER